jgi:hypothetical protein
MASVTTPQLSTVFGTAFVPATSLIWVDLSSIAGVVEAAEVQVFFTYG